MPRLRLLNPGNRGRGALLGRACCVLIGPMALLAVAALAVLTAVTFVAPMLTGAGWRMVALGFRARGLTGPGDALADQLLN